MLWYPVYQSLVILILYICTYAQVSISIHTQNLRSGSDCSKIKYKLGELAVGIKQEFLKVGVVDMDIGMNNLKVPPISLTVTTRLSFQRI